MIRFLVLMMMVCLPAFGQENIVNYTDKSLPILNEELRRTRSSTSANGASIVSIQADLASKFTSGVLNIANGGTGQDTAQEAIDALLPTQGSASGKFLTTNGTNASWGTVAPVWVTDTMAVIANSASEPSTTGTSWVKLKEITVNGSGSVTATCQVKSGAAGHPSQFRFYKNESAIGTQYSEVSGAFVTITLDVTGLSVGDRIQMYCYGGSGYTGYAKNLSLYGTTQTIGL